MNCGTCSRVMVQRDGQLPVEHLLGALHIALIDEAELFAALGHLAALGAHILDQLQEVGAGVVLDALLIVLVEKAEVGVFIDFRGHLRNAVDERERFLARDHGRMNTLLSTGVNTLPSR